MTDSARPHGPTTAPIETGIGRLLSAATLAAVVLLAIGSLLLLLAGSSPLDSAPGLDPARLLSDLASVQPSGFLWPGLLLVLVTPAARVVATLPGYLRRGERGMAVVAALVLVVIAAGVAAATIGG